ncbi:glycosyltransferase family 4 protein [Planctomycetes bacterium K23_9]|uniref:Alpha-D-kanosaminyltransferase n=1 Tax=Stieleria marina TaxID=1930275 RepID=A0A517NNT3_9BACT|nr:Alpha-D-kanosaminyltransferase [Planctomycetes bacterium K23_9]
MSTVLDDRQNLADRRVVRPKPAQRQGKVAYLVNQYPFPSSTFIRREIEALESMGVEVFRYSIRQTSVKLSDPKDLLEASRTTVVLNLGTAGLAVAATRTFFTRPLKFLKGLFLTLRSGWHSDRGMLFNFIYLFEACQLLRWLDEDQIEHLHAHYGTNSATVAMLCHAMGGPPFSFTLHGPHEFDKPEFLKLGAKVARAKFAVAISEYGRSQLYRWTDYRHWGKIHVVHCGLDREFLSAPYTPPSPDRQLLFIGRLAEQKGTHVLVEAANLLKGEGFDFEIVMVGDGPMRDELADLISHYGLDDTVVLAGWKKDAQVREALTNCRALVLPSFAEGLPVVIMEALAMGRPVISTNIAGVAELVQPNVCGWLVPAGAVEPLAHQMREVLEMPAETLAEYGQRGAEMVADRHDARHEAEKLADLMQLRIVVRD